MNATLIKGPNCRACDEFLPILQSVAKRHGFYVQVVDAQDEPILVQKFKIRSVPTTIFYCNGTAQTIVGKVSAERLESLIKTWGEDDQSAIRVG